MTMNYDSLINGAVAWWKSVSPKEGFDSHKGDRAELRRCHSTEEVMYVPLYHELLKRTQADYENHDLLQSLAAVAWVLSWVDGESETKFAAQLAQTKPVFQTIRFRRLLECAGWNELALQLIRALRFTKQTANPEDLISSILKWNLSGSVKENWALDYYRNVSE